jgi:regulator of CtrA degradation
VTAAPFLLFAPAVSPGNYTETLIVCALDRAAAKRDAVNCLQLAAWALSMSDPNVRESEPVSFGQKLAGSQVFAASFRDGMALVEETAAYLDGLGRQESKKLDRAAALAYATESMRLTTRLMQLASWLLLHRAVNEGEMSLAQANREKTKVKLSSIDVADEETVQLLPTRLQQLIERSRELQLKVLRLDATIHAPSTPTRPPGGSPVERQLGLLKAAFEQDE